MTITVKAFKMYNFRMAGGGHVGIVSWAHTTWVEVVQTLLPDGNYHLQLSILLRLVTANNRGF